MQKNGSALTSKVVALKINIVCLFSSLLLVNVLCINLAQCSSGLNCGLKGVFVCLLFFLLLCLHL